MTDADGFYRPRGLPQDLVFDDDDDDDKDDTQDNASSDTSDDDSYADLHLAVSRESADDETASASSASSASSSSGYTLYSHSSTASYLLPALAASAARQPPVSVPMSDRYGECGFVPYAPHYSPPLALPDYRPPPPQQVPQYAERPSPPVSHMAQIGHVPLPAWHMSPLPAMAAEPHPHHRHPYSDNPHPHHPHHPHPGTAYFGLPFHSQDPPSFPSSFPPSFPSSTPSTSTSFSPFSPPSAGKRGWIPARRFLLLFSLAAFVCLILWHSLHALDASAYGFLPGQQQQHHQQFQPLPPPFCAQHAAASSTAFASHGSHTLHLPANSFSFVEAADDVGLAGSVYVRTAPAEFDDDNDNNDNDDSNNSSNGNNVTVEYDIVASAPELVTFIVSRSGSVEMRAVGGGGGWGHRQWRRWRRPRSQLECLTARITITLPARHRRQQRLALALATTTLPVELADSVALHSLQVTTRHANMRSLARVASSTSVVLRSGSISGTFDWGRLLQLETLAGSITAAIHPLDSTNTAANTAANTTAATTATTTTISSRPCPDDADNAVLLAQTVTGSITLSLALDAAGPPRRNYSSTVATASGAISGTYLFGSSARFSAATGSIHATLLPVDVYGYGCNDGTGNGNGTANGTAIAPARLATDAKHGATTVRFSRPLGRKRVEGRHTAVTGRVDVRYPRDWQGQVSAAAIMGDVDVTGPGVAVTKRAWGVVEAVKGSPALGRIDARSDVGGVLVSVR